MQIAFDLDMTLNDMAYTWIRWLREHIDPFVELKNCKYHYCFRDAYGEAADAYWKDPAAYDEIRLLDGARELLLWYPDSKIITQTPAGQSQEVKDAWVKNHIGNIKVIHSADKHLHSSGCILVDDNPAHIHRHVRHNENCHGIIFNHYGRYGWAWPLCQHPRVSTACTFMQLNEQLEALRGNVR